MNLISISATELNICIYDRKVEIQIFKHKLGGIEQNTRCALHGVFRKFIDALAKRDCTSFLNGTVRFFYIG